MPGDSSKMSTPLRQFITLLFRAYVLALVILSGCQKIEKSLTKGLEEEKSYTRHAMEYHREHPDKRRGDSVLDTWSAADYIALNVAKQNLPGEWAKTSDQMPLLPTDLRSDVRGRPFCVIQRSQTIVVLRFLDKATIDCTLDAVKQLDISKIDSGDMEFSGRTDYWVYVLRPDQNESKSDHHSGQ